VTEFELLTNTKMSVSNKSHIPLFLPQIAAYLFFLLWCDILPISLVQHTLTQVILNDNPSRGNK